MVHSFERFPNVRLEKLPRMADLALWGTACETAFWPPGTFMRAYEANRRAAIVGVIEAEPAATLVREIMAERSTSAGQASDLLHARVGEKNVPNRTRLGRQILVRSPPGCGAARPFSGPPALRLPFAVKAEWVAA